MDAVVFEISNEVANKVGGIHAVLASKAPQMRKNFSEYYAVGPYDPKNAVNEFEQEEDHPFHDVFLRLGEQGLKCSFGNWTAADNVNCILVDPIEIKHQLNGIKTELWEKYGVDSLRSWELFDWSVVWGKAVGMVMQEILKMGQFKDSNVVCQFHEWLSGAALLHMRSSGTRAGLVFTTHATTAGRTMSERGEDLIREVQESVEGGKSFDDARAKGYDIECVHTLEKACAHNADVFTTVSQVTGDEAAYILGKRPDALTQNGLAIGAYPSMEELSISHRRYWRRIRHFALGYFSPYFDIDLDNYLYFFTAGRYELHNKGFDILVEALGRLNDRLKKEKSKKKLVFFFWVPAKTKGGNIEVMENLSLYEAIEEEVSGNMQDIRDDIVESVCMGKLPTKSKIFDEAFLRRLKQMIVRLRAKRGGNAPISVLELEDRNDTINRLLIEKGLDNNEDDPVKVIYYPMYLSSADGLLGLNYKEAVMGCHLGVFPSYYEPWGYTPLETAALAVPSVTTDQSGFGKFIQEQVEGEKAAICVLDRQAKGDGEAVSELVDYMHFILNTSKKERVTKKLEAKRLSELADWEKLIGNYVSAYGLASERAKERIEDA